MTPGNIILLNGAAGAGKTSIVQALQAVLDTPYLDMGVDKLVSMLPDAYLERPLGAKALDCTAQAGLFDRLDPCSPQLISGMHHTIAALARAGNHVIAAHVLIEPGWLRECAQLFCELPTFFVGIRCPLEILAAREQAPGNRPFGRAHFGAVHIPGVYDLEVDTTNPDERYVYLTASHQEALIMCGRLIQNREGSGLIVSDQGTGKTTIMRRLTGLIRDVCMLKKRSRCNDFTIKCSFARHTLTLVYFIKCQQWLGRRFCL